MRIAEIVIKEYIQNGYSIEQLRGLVQNRPEPLRSELLGILDEMEQIDEVQCECTTVDSVSSVTVDCASSGMVENVSKELGTIVSDNEEKDILGNLPPEEALAESKSNELFEPASVATEANESKEEEPIENSAQPGDLPPAIEQKDEIISSSVTVDASCEIVNVENDADAVLEHPPTTLPTTEQLPAITDAKAEERRRQRRYRRAQRRALKKLQKEQAKALSLATENDQSMLLMSSTAEKQDHVEDNEQNEGDRENNVILFSEACDLSNSEENLPAPPVLRLLTNNDAEMDMPALPMRESSIAEDEAQASANIAAEANANAAAADEARTAAEAQAQAALAEAAAAHAAEEAARKEVEQIRTDYEARIAKLSGDLEVLRLDSEKAQTTIQEYAATAEKTGAELTEMNSQLSDARQTIQQLQNDLGSARDDASSANKKLDTFTEALDEHKRLYKEFEDLRTAYNEIVTTVMPGLQKERDDLAYTVEKQSLAENTMRQQISRSRKHIATGYALGAAACAAFVALPVINWFKSDAESRILSQDRMQVGELTDRLEKAERRNVENDTEIFNLKRRINEQTALLEEKSNEINRLSDKRAMITAMNSRDAAHQNSTPVRVTEVMTLAGANDGLLRYNDVRDPSGRIGEVAAANSAARNRAATENLVSARPGRVAVQAIAKTPSGAGQTANKETSKPKTPKDQTLQAKPDEILATVHAGDSVALMVYRELGTRDPDVIEWVIRENNLKTDKRGNPRIYPDQKLRLPKNGKVTSTASR